MLRAVATRRFAAIIPLALCCAVIDLAAADDAPRGFINSIEMKFVLVPPGEFLMGAEEPRAATLIFFPYCEPRWLNGEQPRHRVRITRSFYLSQYETTLRQFLIFYHDSGYKLDCERDGRPSRGYTSKGHLIESSNFRPWAPGWAIGMDHPAVYVSWNDASVFCYWLSKKERKKYRLPTEAEWEYACRAGTSTRYSFGDDPEQLVRYGNVADADLHAAIGDATLVKFDLAGRPVGSQLPFPFVRGRDGYAWSAPVGRFRPNAFGLYDMHGNVWEWCADWYDRDYYHHSPADDPRGPSEGKFRVARGGGFYSVPVGLRCARRGRSPASYRDFSRGFRVVCEP